MRVFSGILIQLGQLVSLKQWMVSQGNAQGQGPRVIQEGLNSRQLYCTPTACFKCNKQGHYSRLRWSKNQSTTTSTPNSNRNTRGSWCSRGRGGRGHGSRHAVYETETTDSSKPIADATNSEVDIVKLLQAYGMVPTEGLELKHRRNKVATDEISIVPIQTLGDNFTFEPKPLVL